MESRRACVAGIHGYVCDAACVFLRCCACVGPIAICVMSGYLVLTDGMVCVCVCVCVQSKLLQQSLQFTGMGGPMGVYEGYDT